MEWLDASATILEGESSGFEQQPGMLQKSVGVKGLSDFQLSPYGSNALVVWC